MPRQRATRSTRASTSRISARTRRQTRAPTDPYPLPVAPPEPLMDPEDQAHIVQGMSCFGPNNESLDDLNWRLHGFVVEDSDECANIRGQWYSRLVHVVIQHARQDASFRETLKEIFSPELVALDSVRRSLRRSAARNRQNLDLYSTSRGYNPEAFNGELRSCLERVQHITDRRNADDTMAVSEAVAGYEAVLLLMVVGEVVRLHGPRLASCDVHADALEEAVERLTRYPDDTLRTVTSELRQAAKDLRSTAPAPRRTERLARRLELSAAALRPREGRSTSPSMAGEGRSSGWWIRSETE